MLSLSHLYQGYLIPASTLLPLTAGILFYKQINRPLKTLLAYLSFSLVINVIGVILAMHRTNNLPLLNFYSIFELLFVMLYYRQTFSNRAVSSQINLIMIAFPVLCIINFSFVQSLYEFNTYTRPLEAIIVIVYSILYLSGYKSQDKAEFITTSGRWVANGFLIYFCSSVFQFIFSNVVSRYASHGVKMTIWNLHATFVLCMYICFYYAILNGRLKR